MCINQKELKQNKISEMDGVYHHIKYSSKVVLVNMYLITWTTFNVSKMAENLERKKVTTNPVLMNESCITM